MASKEAIQIGEITAPHGIWGAVRVQLTTDFPERLTSLAAVWLDEVRGSPWECAEWRVQGSAAILRLAAVATRDQALTLKGRRLVLPTDALPPLGKDAFYWHQLVGLRVEDADGRGVGRVVHVRRRGGAHDFLEVQKDDGGVFWLPMVRPLVSRVDLAEGVVYADLPPGLEDLPSW